MTKPTSFFILALAALLIAGCAPKVQLFTDAADPLEEYVLEGEGKAKLAYIPLTGVISDSPAQGLLRTRPSVVQEVVSRLKLAEADEAVRAVVLAVDSPGGTATASDMLYHEIGAFKERTGKPVVAVFLDVAASGGYYAALPADRILAHPTTVTGSVGAVFYQPRVHGLLDKLGVEVEVAKSGRNKDMGSPFREPSDEERELAQGIIDELAGRFLELVRQHRKLGAGAMETVATARVFTASQALDLGLVDEVGYLSDAFGAARKLAGVADARVVVYRQEPHANDTAYNTMAAQPWQPSLLGGAAGVDAAWLLPPRSGFCYLWLGPR
ncbi:MAG: signal peptide peptidase SppA [Desulfovibrionaceae bacterium]